ncbi:hypothetical protein F5Y06DRAFT_295309 [Hypoxylon sp. FL0890]|nr:hypothetical protein F5Y06DRAFT_295309 [Hypoxylon sp. FL0890]
MKPTIQPEQHISSSTVPNKKQQENTDQFRKWQQQTLQGDQPRRAAARRSHQRIIRRNPRHVQLKVNEDMKTDMLQSDSKDQSAGQDNSSTSGQGQGQGGGGGAYVSPPDFFSFNDPGDDFSAN